MYSCMYCSLASNKVINNYYIHVGLEAVNTIGSYIIDCAAKESMTVDGNLFRKYFMSVLFSQTRLKGSS